MIALCLFSIFVCHIARLGVSNFYYLRLHQTIPLNIRASMIQIEYKSENMNGTKYKNEIAKEDATDLNSLVSKHTISCRMCRLPKIGSNQVRPNGLRGCKCDALSPHHNSNFPTTNLRSPRSVPPCPKKLSHTHHPAKSTIENLASPRHENCTTEANPLEKRSFAPPQGMNTGEYPRALFYQYYTNRNEDYTFDLLPLPFMDRLKYQEMRAQSIEDRDVQEKWKDFLYNLPNSEFQSIPYPDDRFWRWKNYLKYAPHENRYEFRHKMQVGPKYDNVGRLPITGEDLQIFRAIKFKPKTNVKYILRKDDGTRG